MDVKEERILKMENSVEEIRNDIQDIKSALIGNNLSGEKGLIGQIDTLKTKIETLQADLAVVQKDAIRNGIIIGQLKFVTGGAVLGVIALVVRLIFG